MSIPRPEHPKPQFCRESWQNLNGEWQFAFDFGSSNPGDYEKPGIRLDRTILVPFCPESRLSGIGYTDFMNTVWYKRTVAVTAAQLAGRVLLHFGAVDYETTVYVNGKEAGTHRGGYSSFELDITAHLTAGDNEITVRADDRFLRSGTQARGKQCPHYHSRGCDYTRTTGIWQTVWLEFVPTVYLKRVRVDTDYQSGNVTFAAELAGGDAAGLRLRAAVRFGGKEVAETELPAALTNVFGVTVADPQLWDVGQPNLYDVVYELIDGGGRVVDRVASYFGIRGVETKNHKLYINGRPVFQRLVLDQGFYPDGIYTAPTDADLKRDIELSMATGFNGARLHQKVFEERFLYHADTLGYIVWGEHANWGVDGNLVGNIHSFLPEWLEVVERDYNHPAIVCWCPFNEVNDHDHAIHCPDLLRSIYHVTKALDKQRPVIDVSGFFHVYPTDIYDTHDYEQNVEVFRQHYADIRVGERIHDPHHYGQKYAGGPFFVSEYGGARWSAQQDNSWGYGETPKDMQAFLDRYVGLTTALIENENVCGFCYTQLYDIEQEQNGLYTYAREPKFPPEIYDGIREANQQTAGVEKAAD